jgi:hypothetical protein
MDSPTSSSGDDYSSGTVIVERRTVRRPLGTVFWVSAVITVLLITIGLGVTGCRT